MVASKYVIQSSGGERVSARREIKDEKREGRWERRATFHPQDGEDEHYSLAVLCNHRGREPPTDRPLSFSLRCIVRISVSLPRSANSHFCLTQLYNHPCIFKACKATLFISKSFFFAIFFWIVSNVRFIMTLIFVFFSRDDFSQNPDTSSSLFLVFFSSSLFFSFILMYTFVVTFIMQKYSIQRLLQIFVRKMLLYIVCLQHFIVTIWWSLYC